MKNRCQEKSEACSNPPAAAKGLCWKHYARMRRREKGVPEAVNLGYGAPQLCFKVTRATQRRFFHLCPKAERSAMLRRVLEDWLGNMERQQSNGERKEGSST